MMNSKGRPLVFLFIAWMFIVPTGIAYLIITQPPQDLNWTWLFLSVLLGVLSLYFPIRYQGKSVILFVWFTLPIFLLYGLTTELLTTQLIVTIAVLLRWKSGDLFYRILYNSLAYFVLSVSGAVAYFLAGGETGSLSFWMLTATVLIYQVIYSLQYDWIFKLYNRLTSRTRRDSVKETILHYLRMIVVVPLAISLYYLLQFYGFIGFLILGIPFFFITIVIRMKTQTENLNDLIKEAGEIGQQIARITEEEKVITEYLSKTAVMFKVDYVYLFKHVDDWLELTHLLVGGRQVPLIDGTVHRGEGIAGKALFMNEPRLYNKREEWISESVKLAPEGIESLLCMPIVRNQKNEGVLILGHTRVNAFKDVHLRILDLMNSYFMVAVEKARYIEEAQRISDRCALTGLYNYRAFEEKLEASMELLRQGIFSNLSLVMLDIDRFKQVNDTYGHESGNAILQQFASVLSEKSPSNGTLARYGGEEFVYLLPNFTKEEAVHFAESLRHDIRNEPMRIPEGLTNHNEELCVMITSSIGVSTALEDTDEAMTLLRNADRALYIGAKQAGRDRVASYVK